MPAQITMDGLGSGLDQERMGTPLRLPPPRVPSRYRLTSRRRRDDAHRVMASVLAVLGLVGCVTAILLLAIQPTAARMQRDIAALNARLANNQDQLSALRATAVSSAARGARLTRSVAALDRRTAGLGRSVHGLRVSSAMTREQSTGLRVCFARLQQELSGLMLKTRSVHGHVTDVGLTDQVGPATACRAAFSEASQS